MSSRAMGAKLAVGRGWESDLFPGPVARGRSGREAALVLAFVPDPARE